MILQRSFAYAIISAICLLLHNVIMIVADSAGCPITLSVLLSFLTVAVAGYQLHSRFSFRRSASWNGLGRYFVAMSANIPTAIVMTWLWHDVVGLPMYGASLIATFCMVIVNYGLSQWAIVRNSQPRGLK